MPSWVAPPRIKSSSDTEPDRMNRMRRASVVFHTLASYVSIHPVPARTASLGHDGPADAAGTKATTPVVTVQATKRRAHRIGHPFRPVGWETGETGADSRVAWRACQYRARSRPDSSV